MSNYNLTDLDPERSFERHVFHRDQFAHYLRWTHVLKQAKIGEVVVDFGCGKGNLLEVYYRNLYACKAYHGIDIRHQTIKKAKEKYANVPWAHFHVGDLVKNDINWKLFKADKVISFEVLEHVGKQNADKFMKNFMACGKPNATYFISTPNFKASVGAAGNHTYDSGDGRGVAVQEFTMQELEKLFQKHAIIKQCYGTFASQKDYEHLLVGWKAEMYKAFQKYYSNHLLSAIVAPLFPAHSRNTLWILKQKDLGL